MKHLNEIIKKWFIPPGFMLLKRILDKKWQEQKYSSILESNESFKDIHRGKRCFILATGPSIKEQNLVPLKDEICIAVSNFIAHPDFNIIKPMYYCIAPSHPPITEEQWSSFLIDVNDKNPYSNYFIGASDKYFVDKYQVFGNRINYMNFNGQAKDSFGDICSILEPPRSVTIQALDLALFMGFDQIYLLGVDHSWINHLGVSSHFYEEKEHKMVEKGYNEWDPSLGTLEDQWCQYYELWVQYRKIREMALKNNTRIFNATQGGLLDVFPRVRYVDLFTEK